VHSLDGRLSNNHFWPYFCHHGYIYVEFGESALRVYVGKNYRRDLLVSYKYIFSSLSIQCLIIKLGKHGYTTLYPVVFGLLRGHTDEANEVTGVSRRS
jgi:hypothetical protein